MEFSGHKTQFIQLKVVFFNNKKNSNLLSIFDAGINPTFDCVFSTTE